MEEVLMAMHEDAIHRFNHSNTSSQLYWNGRAQAITDILALIRHDKQVQAYYTQQPGGGDEAAA